MSTSQADNRQLSGIREDRMTVIDSAHSGPGPAVVGSQLAAYRRRALLTQEQLAERAGVSVRTIRHLEAGQVGRPRSQTLSLLAAALGLTDPERAELVAAAGAIGAPPRPSPAGPGSQLPMDVSGFTGRAEHLAQLDAWLPPGPEAPATMVISAIGGTAGVGKTALAVHWAHRVRDRFPDGQLYVQLEGYGPGPPLPPLQALSRLLQALRVAPDRVPVDLEAAAGLYRSLLADRRVLLVLDNARSAEQVRPLLPAGPGCAVVVTSRDRLTGLVATHGAHRLRLDVLAPGDADVLLARIVGPERVAAEPEAAAELARVCGFLPLALRIAAANLLDQSGRTIGEYLAELDTGDRLAGLGIEGDGQSTVQAAFDSSYAALGGPARRLFRLLGLMPGPEVTPSAAAALAGVASGQAAGLLEQLAGAHLVEPRAPGRFGLHDLLRRYARLRTEREDDQAEREAATGRLLGWYLHTVDAADRLYPQMLRLPLPEPDAELSVTGFAGQADAQTWLDAERTNLVAAVESAAEHGPHPMAWQLGDALRGYFWRRRHMVDWLVVARAGLTAAEAADDPLGMAAAHRNLGMAYHGLSEYTRSAEHFELAITLARRAGWLEGAASAHNTLAAVNSDLGRLEQTAAHLTEALALNRAAGSLDGQAIALANLGDTDRELGRLEEAADYVSQALTLYQELGESGQTTALDTLGEIYRDLGRLDEARTCATQALTLAVKLGSHYDEAYDRQILATIDRDAGRYAEALEGAEAALALSRDLGEPRFEAVIRTTLGSVLAAVGRTGEAVEEHRTALDLARRVQASYPETEALIGLAVAGRLTGDHAAAAEHARLALGLAGRIGYRVLEGQAGTALAAVSLARGCHEEAAGHAGQALELHRATGHRLGAARTLVILGHALAHRHGPAAARPHWREALALFTAIGNPGAAEVRALLGAEG
jgi:tetratricopeptide (TPR) repeat protein/transcriptional regulator with XRE-family HTH domain